MRFVKSVMEGVLSLMSELELIAEIIYNNFNMTRGIGGQMVHRSWADLPKKEKDRWIRIAKPIEQYVQDRESIALAHGLLSSELHKQEVIKARIDQVNKMSMGMREIESKYDEGTEKDFAFNIAIGKMLQVVSMDLAELKKGLNEK